ncbi:MAG: glycosyl hydrolase family 57 [Desulfococcaceae bacterium]
MRLLSDTMEGGLPNICGSEDAIAQVTSENRRRQLYLPESGIDFTRLRACAANALHMHQPLIPAGGPDLSTADVISNLQYMMEHPNEGDNHNAPVFHWCYKRMGEFIPDLVAEGKRPRIMLDYSGTLLYGLRKMGLEDVVEHLRRITCDPALRPCVEWLGTAWGHPVAPSTPVQDFRLHVRAWQHHFASLFGTEALARVRGFSPPEMALPNHPDVAYAFVKTLKDCGYTWVLVQEHTIERPADGSPPESKHLPHRLVCTNSAGETVSITVVFKTQGSDTKLVGQMQPYYEAKGLNRMDLAGNSIPPIVFQIADGENGGVMMNEFPPKYQEVVRESAGGETALVNLTEYLEYLESLGMSETDFPEVQPIHQHRIWERMAPGEGPDRLAEVIEAVEKADDRFHMEGGSWTGNISWVRGYEDLLGPMETVSARFHEKVLRSDVSTSEYRYRNALFYLMVSQTSCYRYWGQGRWTDYGRELCRRTEAILTHDF